MGATQPFWKAVGQYFFISYLSFLQCRFLASFFLLAPPISFPPPHHPSHSIRRWPMLTTPFMFFNITKYRHLSMYTYICRYLVHLQCCETTIPNPPTAFPPWCPYVCSVHLCLDFCPANWFICTIFLGSTYMHSYRIFVINWEIGIDMYTLMCIKLMSNKNLLYKKINKIKFKSYIYKKKQRHRLGVARGWGAIVSWVQSFLLGWWKCFGTK